MLVASILPRACHLERAPRPRINTSTYAVIPHGGTLRLRADPHGSPAGQVHVPRVRRTQQRRSAGSAMNHIRYAASSSVRRVTDLDRSPPRRRAQRGYRAAAPCALSLSLPVTQRDAIYRRSRCSLSARRGVTEPEVAAEPMRPSMMRATSRPPAPDPPDLTRAICGRSQKRASRQRAVMHIHAHWAADIMLK